MLCDINNCINLTPISEKIIEKMTCYVFSYESSFKKFDQKCAFPNSRSSNQSKFKLDPFRTEKMRSKEESDLMLTPSCIKTLAQNFLIDRNKLVRNRNKLPKKSNSFGSNIYTTRTCELVNFFRLKKSFPDSRID